MQLQQKAAERTKLLSQLEQAKMQEKVAASLQSMDAVTANGSPNLDQVREKIERRYANALGQSELAQNSVQGRMAEVERAGIQMAGHSRLEQIRAEMNSGNNQLSGSQQQEAIEQAKPQAGNVGQDAVAERMRQLRNEN